MSEFYNGKCSRVFEIFEEISAIPRGSGYMDKISKYCVDFAEKCGLKSVRDDANNVIIYKGGSVGFEDKPPVILQGHLDIVWQKSPDSTIDFLNDGISLYREGDFLCARDTTLGADNGIAVAMALSILECSNIPHPPIEAVFTTDEEIGMLGAAKLDTSLLSSKRFINLDSEEDDTITVSCAGGSDFKATLPLNRVKKFGCGIKITLDGLKGGHSGVEINSHRVNANMLAGRLLNSLYEFDFDIISVNGGNKINAITNHCVIELLCNSQDKLTSSAEQCINEIKREISYFEENFSAKFSHLEEKEYSVFDNEAKTDIIYSLLCVPNGVVEMSAEIEGLVETSLNLGILQTFDNSVEMQFALRSNKSSSLRFLEEKLKGFFGKINAKIKTGGHYPPWEYRENSPLKNLYIETYEELVGTKPNVLAIHAGLECAVFSSSIQNADCIAIGPTIFDAHTVNERLSISSTEKVYNILLKLLGKL